MHSGQQTSRASPRAGQPLGEAQPASCRGRLCRWPRLVRMCGITQHRQGPRLHQGTPQVIQPAGQQRNFGRFRRLVAHPRNRPPGAGGALLQQLAPPALVVLPSGGQLGPHPFPFRSGPRCLRRALFNPQVVHHVAAANREEEGEAPGRQVGGNQFARLAVGQAIDQLLQPQLARLEAGHPHAITLARFVTLFANLPQLLLIGPGIVEVQRGWPRGMTIDQQVPPGHGGGVVVIVGGEREGNPLGGGAIDSVVDQVERDFDPLPRLRGRPLVGLPGREPALARAGDNLQPTTHHPRCRRGGTLPVELSPRGVVARGDRREVVRPGRRLEVFRQQQFTGLAMTGQPLDVFAPQAGQFRGQSLFVRLPPLAFPWQERVHRPVLGVDPVLGIERREPDRLELVVLPLRDWLELVVVTAGAVHRQPQECGERDLQARLERRATIDLERFRLLHANVGPVLAVPQKVRRFEQLDRRQVGRFAGAEPRQFIPRQLFHHKPVERFVGVETADHVIAVPMGQRAVGVGREIAVRIGVPRGIQPMLAPPLGIGGRSEILFDRAVVVVFRWVGEKLLQLGGGGREAGQVERQPPELQGRCRRRTEVESLHEQRLSHKCVDGGRFAVAGGVHRDGGPQQRLKGPVIGPHHRGLGTGRQPRGPRGDPVPQPLLLGLGERGVGGHFARGDPLPERALCQVPRHHGGARFPTAGQPQWGPQLQFPLGLERAMTLQAPRLHNRPHLLEEEGGTGGRGFRCRRGGTQRQHPQANNQAHNQISSQRNNGRANYAPERWGRGAHRLRRGRDCGARQPVGGGANPRRAAARQPFGRGPM